MVKITFTLKLSKLKVCQHVSIWETGIKIWNSEQA
jgi:hypothetical protein